METMISAAENPELVNKLIQDTFEKINNPETAVDTSSYEAITPPSPDQVSLLAGLYDSFTGDLVKTAQVRELNGEDEEAVSRASDPGKALLTILSRGVTKIGDKQASTELLDRLLSGDREYLLIQIRRITLGDEVPFSGNCPECGVESLFTLNLSTVETTTLDDPKNRSFDISCKIGTVTVELPSGSVQRKIIESKDKTSAEMDTLLLRECVVAVNGMPIIDKNSVKKFGILDRREILKQIAEKSPGPKLMEMKAPCSSCGKEVEVPVSLVDIFRL